MKHSHFRRAMYWRLIAILFALTACGSGDLPEEISAEQTVVQQAATPAITGEATSTPVPTATQTTAAPTAESVAAADCAWDTAEIIGRWVNERGEQYEFTEAGNYYYQESAGDPATGGTWACARSEEPSIILTAGYWRGNASFGSETPVHVIHRIILNGDDVLSLEKAPILTGVFDEFTPLNE